MLLEFSNALERDIVGGSGAPIHDPCVVAYLIAPHVGSQPVELGEVEEVLTDNAPLALQGVLWELDQDIGALATDVAPHTGQAMAPLCDWSS